jgi:hypothetical protein
MHQNHSQITGRRMRARQWQLALVWAATLLLLAVAAAVVVVAVYRARVGAG